MIRFNKIQHNVRELFPELSDYFASKPEVEFAYVFGSYGEGTEGPLSDVDVAVFLDDTVPHDRYFEKRLEMMGDAAYVLKTDEVDLIVLNEVDLVFAYCIVSTREVLFERNLDRRVEFEVRTIDRYLDSVPLRRVQDEVFLVRLSEAQ